MSSNSALFRPIQVGDVELRHRVVLAPSTQFRSNGDVPSPIMAEYYAQRGSTPGTLLIAEATFIAKKAGGFKNVPGIWSTEQITAWKRVTDAVHAKGSFIYLQLWALGRCAYVEHLAPGDPYVSSSPKKLGTPFHKEYSELFAVAASNAFLTERVNQRTDQYGGSIENRARFTLEMIDVVVGAVGASKAAIRLSPWADLQETGMADPKPTYTYLVTQIRDRHPNLSYLHIVEPYAHTRSGAVAQPGERPSNDFVREIWGNRRIVSAGGYSDNRESGLRAAEERGEMIAYSRAFIANVSDVLVIRDGVSAKVNFLQPDLPCRLAQDVPLFEGDESKYYYGSDPSGYTDYPFHFNSVNTAVAVGA
ncbi:NADH:flavin oxidoreductase/NADH oxidase [Mycena crocata]|nr:NADH:flavin oxidoreductase/NADH oxidase [Mycena crocata]